MKILVLAGGYDQIEFIKEIKKKENCILLADYYENPPAREYADCFYNISTLDEEEIYQLAQKEQVDLVVTACTDQALLTMANVSRRLQLPCYITKEQAAEVTNKFYMKQKFAANGIHTAEFYVFDCESKMFHYAETNKKYPMIVKPCDCNSSKGVRKVNTKEELKAALKIAYDLSRSKKVIIEEYIEGMELSIDLWVDKKHPRILSISETKKNQENINDFTIISSSFPVHLREEQETKLAQEIKKIVKVFHIDRGPLLIQTIVNENDIYIVEFSMRMGGGSKYKFIQYTSGVNIMEHYANFILSGDSTLPDIDQSDMQYELDYIYAYDGQIKELRNFEKIRQEEWAKEVFIYKTPGDIITKKTTSSDRVAGILIEGADKEEIIKKREKILDMIQILDMGGSNILYSKCFHAER